MRKDSKAPKNKRKRKLIRSVIVELIFMAVGVCVIIMPMPYRLIVPMIIGARSIIMQAYRYLKEPQEPEFVHCCNSATEQSKKAKKQENKSKKQ